jgi:hypothetical protein
MLVEASGLATRHAEARDAHPVVRQAQRSDAAERRAEVTAAARAGEPLSEDRTAGLADAVRGAETTVRAWASANSETLHGVCPYLYRVSVGGTFATGGSPSGSSDPLIWLERARVARR